MAESTETTYYNYHFFENLIIPVVISKSVSFANSPDELSKVVLNPQNKMDVITTEMVKVINGNLESNAGTPYAKYYSSIFAPEEVLTKDDSFEEAFYATKQQIVVNVDLTEVIQDSPWHGKANVTIDVFAFRNMLIKNNKITCAGGNSFKEGEGCHHTVPPDATHVTFGTFNPDKLIEVLEPIYGSADNIPVYERVTPYIKEMTKVQAFPGKAGDWDNVTVTEGDYDGFLSPGVYLSAEPAFGGQAKEKQFFEAEILNGPNEGDIIYVSDQHLKLVTWASVDSLTKEPKPVKEVREKINDLPVVDEPPKALTLYTSLGATHIVRNPQPGKDKTTMRSEPGAGKRIGELGKDTAVEIIEQSVGPKLRYHRVKVADPVAGVDLIGQEGFIKAAHLRPISKAKQDGVWFLLPTVDQKNADSRTAGKSPALEKIWETEDICAPWVAKDEEAYWNSKYQIVYKHPAPIAGLKSKDLVEEHKIKALAQMTEYFDKSKKVEDIPLILALIKHAVVHEDYYRDKNVFKSLVSVPIRFFDAMRRNNEPFDFDYEPDLERIRNNAAAIAMVDKLLEYSNPSEEMRKIINKSSEITKSEGAAEAYEKVSQGATAPDAGPVDEVQLNPSVDGEKVAFTSGFYASEIQENIKKLKKVFKYYGRQIKRSKQTVKFPGFSVPLDMKEEEKYLDEWFQNIKGFLELNDHDFSTLAPDEKDRPGKYDPKKTWMEFGWNREFRLLYVLFNGHPLRIGFKCAFYERSPTSFALARTNAFIHRSFDIIKDNRVPHRKRLKWTEWVKKNVYPVAVIEPSDLSSVESKKAKLIDAIEKSKQSTAKTEEEVLEEEANLKDPEISAEIQSQAENKDIDTRDQVFANLPEIIKTVKDIDDVYDLVVNKLPFQNIILEFTRCIGQDLDAQSLVELLIRLALKEIFGDDYEKNMRIIEDVLEILELAAGCTLDILEKAFVLVVEESVPDEPPDPDEELPEYPVPPPAPTPENSQDADAANQKPAATHVVGPEGSIPKKGIPFFKTLPWETNEAYGTVNAGTAYQLVDVINPPNIEEIYPGGNPPPSLADELTKIFYQVKTIDKIANLAPGTIGYVQDIHLQKVDDAIADQEAAAAMATAIKKGAQDGKDGLTNEVKALEFYLSNETISEDGVGSTSEVGTVGSYTVGKYTGKVMVEKGAQVSPKVSAVQAKITAARKQKGKFTNNIRLLVKALGRGILLEYDIPENKVHIDKQSAEKMRDDGEVTVAAMEKIKESYLMAQEAMQAEAKLEEIEARLSFNSPEVILGNALYAPPGFYDGQESECSEKYVKLVNKKREYEISFIKQGAEGKDTVKLKLETEKLFDAYKGCMSSAGATVYGNKVSHLFGKDISVEEQQAKDGYKIVFAQEQGECKDLKDALRQALGGTDKYPGTAKATPEQKAAYEAWIKCVNKKSHEEAVKIAEERKKVIKEGITNATHITSQHKFPVNIDEAYKLFVEQGVMPTGLKPKPKAGMIIADIVLGTSGPCAELRDTLIDHLVELILREYPEIEMSVRVTLLAFRKSLELYALIRTLDPENPFGLPKFPKMPIKKHDELRKEFEDALDKVIKEVLFMMIRDLVKALHEVCQLINAENMKEEDLQEASQDILDNFLNHPDSGRIMQDVADKMGLNLAPSVVNNQVVMPSDSASNGYPSLYQFISDIIEDLTRTEICSIIDGSYSQMLFQSVKQSILQLYPQYNQLLSKDSTILAIFAGIAAMMPPDFCDQKFSGMDGDDGTIICLADIIDDREKKRFMNQGLDPDDIDDIIGRKRKRQMDRLVDLAGIIANPEGALNDALPDFCSDNNDILFADPGFNDGLNTAINSSLQMIRDLFNTDIGSFKQRLTQPVMPNVDYRKLQEDFKKNPRLASDEENVGMTEEAKRQGQRIRQALEEDPVGFVSNIADKAAKDPENVDEGVKLMADFLQVEPRFGIFSNREQRLLRPSDIQNLELSANMDIVGSLIYPGSGGVLEDSISLEDLLAAYALPLSAFRKPEPGEDPLGDALESHEILAHFNADMNGSRLAKFQSLLDQMPSAGSNFARSKIELKQALTKGVLIATRIFHAIHGNQDADKAFKMRSERDLLILMDIMFSSASELFEFDTSAEVGSSSYRQAKHDKVANLAIGTANRELTELAKRRKFALKLSRVLTPDGPGGIFKMGVVADRNDLRLPFETSERIKKPGSGFDKGFGDFLNASKNKSSVKSLKRALLNAQEKDIMSINDQKGVDFPVTVDLFAPYDILPKFSLQSTPMLTFELPQAAQFLDYYKVHITTSPAFGAQNPDRFMFDPETGQQINRTKLDPSDPNYKDPATTPETKVVLPAERKEYIDEFALPLYVENFVDKVSDNQEILTEFQPPQVLLLKSFLDKKFSVLFPSGPTFAFFKTVPAGPRAIYNSMLRTLFNNSLRTIGKSKYFFESEITKLNLTPSAEDLNKCADKDKFDPSMSMLDIEGIRKYIKDAFKNDFDSCNSQDPAALEQITAEACVLLFIRVVILEAALNGIYAFGHFDLADLTKESFIKQYLYDKGKQDLRKYFQYKSFKDTAVSILERKRKQDKKFIKLRSPKDSLVKLFSEEAKAVIPIYEKMLGSKVKNYSDVLFSDIIFPVPIDMARIQPIGTSNNVSLDRYNRIIGMGGVSPAINTSRIKSYFGVNSDITVADFKDASRKTKKVEISPGVFIDVSTPDKITMGELFKHNAGFIMEKYVRFEETSVRTLNKKIRALNQKLPVDMIQNLEGNYSEAYILPLPPRAPYVNIDDFFQWLDSLINTYDKIVEEVTNLQTTPLDPFGLANAIVELGELLDANWSGFLKYCDFGMRIKYVLPLDVGAVDNGVPGSQHHRMNLERFKDNMHKSIRSYHNDFQGRKEFDIPGAAKADSQSPLETNATTGEIIGQSKGNYTGFSNGVWNKFNSFPGSADFSGNRVLVNAKLQDGLMATEIPLVETSITMHNMPKLSAALQEGGPSQYGGLGWCTSFRELHENSKNFKSSVKTETMYKEDSGYVVPYAHTIYDTFFLNPLQKKLEKDSDFKAIFEYMLPVRRIINACSIYSLETTEKNYNLESLFSSTKFGIAILHAQMKKNMEGDLGAPPSGEVDRPAEDEMSLEDKIAEIMLGFIIKALLKAPPLIIKGVAEIADPNISVTKKIFDGMDLTVKTALLFVIDSLKIAMNDYNSIARNANQEIEAAAEGGEVDESLLMPVYTSVNEFQALELGINPPIDPNLGIPAPIARAMAPMISLLLFPSALPFGVGFPPPPFGPGIGPPMTPFGIPYLLLGLIKDGGWGQMYPTGGNDGESNPCDDKTSFEQKPNLEDDDD